MDESALLTAEPRDDYVARCVSSCPARLLCLLALRC